MSDLAVERIREFADSLLPTMGLELYDIQFRREGHGWVLRLLIDSLDGVSLEDCTQVSREISVFLDVEDLIGHAYNLEVSSPGLERTLRNLEDCIRFTGEKVRLKLSVEQDGQRVFIGKMTDVDDQILVIVTEEGETYRFSWDSIKKVRLTL